MAVQSWREIATALMASGDKADRDLALAVARYISDAPAGAQAGRRKERKTPKADLDLAKQGLKKLRNFT